MPKKSRRKNKKRNLRTRKKRVGWRDGREKPYSLIHRHLMILVTFTIVNPCRMLDQRTS